jgi:hypothetical protein
VGKSLELETIRTTLKAAGGTYTGASPHTLHTYGRGSVQRISKQVKTASVMNIVTLTECTVKTFGIPSCAAIVKVP